MVFQAVVLAADTGIADAPKALATWVLGVAGALVLVFAIFKGISAIKDENINRFIPVAIVAVVLGFFAYIGFSSWESITTDIGCDVLKLRLDECN